MRARILVLLVIAGAVGFGTVQFTRKWLAEERAASTASLAAAPAPVVVVPSTSILVADANLAPGTFVTPEHLRWQPWPDDDVPSSYIQEGSRPLESFVGAVARSQITVGEPVTDARLVMPGDRGFLAAVLQPGMRAISVPIDETSGIAGLVFPGDRVDIILTHAIPPVGDEVVEHQASETVLTNLRVLALDQSMDNQTEERWYPRIATLEVTARQAEAIRVIARLGSLSLSLRSLADPVTAAADAPTMPAAGVEADAEGPASRKPIETAALGPAAGALLAPLARSEEGLAPILVSPPAPLSSTPATIEVAALELSGSTAEAARSSLDPINALIDRFTAGSDSSLGGTAADEGRQTFTLDSDVSVLLGRRNAALGGPVEPAVVDPAAIIAAPMAPPQPVEDPVVVVVRGSAVRASAP